MSVARERSMTRGNVPVAYKPLIVGALLLALASEAIAQNDVYQMMLSMMAASQTTEAQTRALQETLEKLIQALPPAKQMDMNDVRAALERRSDVQLYYLSFSPDICASKEINCRGLTNTEVKPAIEGILALRRSEAAKADTTRTFLISLSGLGISAISLALSVLALVWKRKQPALDESA
jgi:hypothetical protein